MKDTSGSVSEKRFLKAFFSIILQLSSVQSHSAFFSSKGYSCFKSFMWLYGLTRVSLENP